MLNLAHEDGEVFLLRAFYKPHHADSLYKALLQQLDWQEETLQFAGKKHLAPRLVAWYGDPEAVYRYSGVNHRPTPWTKQLLSIKSDLEQQLDVNFNSVLANLYRNGSDSMGWHADKEKELGDMPKIASLSFGQPRLFKLRHNQSNKALDILLHSGDLLLMSGTLQQHWRHCLPKSKQTKLPRVNLTFRKIIYTHH